MAARKEDDKMGIRWEKKYAEFESYDGMPERGTPQFNWQQNQLSDGAGSLNAKIWEELAENKESAIWSERKVKLANCFEQKNCTIGNAWERKYAEFESYDGMPERGTPQINWQQSQLSKTHGSCVNAKIQKEIEEDEGSTVWME